MTVDSNNSISTARNLGFLPDRTTVFANGSISFADDFSDFYRVDLSQTSTLKFNLAAQPFGAKVQLIRDTNGNKIIDAGERILQLDSDFVAADVNGLAAGTYFLRVIASNARVTTPQNYTLDVTTFPGVGIERVNESPREATNIRGNLNGIRKFEGELTSGGDINDFYKLSIGAPSQVSVFLDRSKDLSSFSPNVDMILFRDANRDGVLQNNEVVARSTQLSNRNELLNLNLTQVGEYFLQLTKTNVGGIDRSSARYDLTLTGTPNSTFSSSSVPRTSGTGGDDNIQGVNIGGIVNGFGGDDLINARGGNDIVMCGAGNDRANGGQGDDLIDGGAGRNRLLGASGVDTFVLSPNGVQVIQDFQDGIDRLGLAKGLVAEVLTFIQQGSNTVIQSGSDPLAILKNVQASSLTGDDFVQVAYAQSGKLSVPIVVG